jgi:hypothetical protein
LEIFRLENKIWNVWFGKQIVSKWKDFEVGRKIYNFYLTNKTNKIIKTKQTNIVNQTNKTNKIIQIIRTK